MDNLREQSKEKAEQILKQLHESTLSMRWKYTDSPIVLRGNYPSHHYNPEYVEVHTVENMWHALAHLIIDKRDPLEDILIDMASGKNPGIKLVRSVLFKTEESLLKLCRSQGEEYKVFPKFQDTTSLEIVQFDPTYVTKAHALASMIFARHNFEGETSTPMRQGRVNNTIHVEDPRAITVLDGLMNKDYGLMHNVYDIDSNVGFCYADSNALITIALALTGNFKLASEYQKQIDESGLYNGKGVYAQRCQAFEDNRSHKEGILSDNALMRIGQVMMDEQSGINEFIEEVERQNPKGLPMRKGIYQSIDDMSEFSKKRPIYDATATAFYSILLNMIGKKEEAFERLNAVSEMARFDIAQFNPCQRQESLPYIHIALAYAELSRPRSFFDTNVINAEYSTVKTSHGINKAPAITNSPKLIK